MVLGGRPPGRVARSHVIFFYCLELGIPLVCLFCIVVVTSILIKSQYAVDDKYFISQYGLIKSKFPVKDVTALTFDTDEKKLTVNFGEQFMVLSVNPDYSEALVRALLAVNPNIDYGFTLAENKPSNENNKK